MPSVETGLCLFVEVASVYIALAPPAHRRPTLLALENLWKTTGPEGEAGLVLRVHRQSSTMDELRQGSPMVGDWEC